MERREGGMSDPYLCDLLQSLFQAIHGLLFSLELFQPRDELGSEGGGFHRGHFLGEPVGSLHRAGTETISQV